MARTAHLERLPCNAGTTLSEFRHSELAEAVKDGELWTLWFTTVPAPEGMRAEIDRRLQLQSQGTMLPFAVIDNATGKAVGMTAYLNIDSANRHVEIGSTPQYRKSCWKRTAL